MPITTKVVSSNPVHGEVNPIQHCDSVCQWLVTGQWFSPGTLVSFTNKTDRHDITEILLKVALNTINQSQTFCCYFCLFCWFIYIITVCTCGDIDWSRRVGRWYGFIIWKKIAFYYFFQQKALKVNIFSLLLVR